MIKYSNIKGKVYFCDELKSLVKNILQQNSIVKVELELSDLDEHRVRMVFWQSTIDSVCMEIADVIDFDNKNLYDYIQRKGNYGKIVTLTKGI